MPGDFLFCQGTDDYLLTFFSLAELNKAIRRKLEEFVHRPFQKKEGTRYEIFRDEELPLLAKLPATPYELAEWKKATVQFNYHI